MKKYRNIFITILVIVCLFGITACKNESKTDYMVLVNKQNKLPENWEETIELVDVKNFQGDNIKVEKKTLEKFYELREDLLKDGITIKLDSTYRTIERQQEIWDDFEKEYGLEYTQKYVAVPGTSEHHTGLAIDIMIVKDGKEIYDNDEMTAEKEIFSKIHAKLAKYGFILRYPEGKEDITGYGAEVWHFRYIDNPTIAKEIMDKGITLEEYLDSK